MEPATVISKVIEILENALVAGVAVCVLFIFYKFGMKALDIIAELSKQED